MSVRTDSRSSLALVADVGGTNTRVAMARGGVVQQRTIQRFSNASFADLETILQRYVADQDAPELEAACVAVAGPVSDGRAELTNLNWSIDAARLCAATGAAQGAILNDLQAQGHALGALSDDSLLGVLPAPATGQTRLVVGVGTGFNAAPVHNMGAQTLVAAAEAGHARLPVRDESDLRLAQFIEKKHGFAAVEDVLSGRGLERVYAWITAEAGTPAEASAADIMNRAQDDAHARATVQTAVRMLGQVTGDLSLNHLPFGGVFLVGGVTRALSVHFETMGFGAAFRDKGRFSDFMDAIPVSVVTDDFAALTGCAAFLQQDLAKGRNR